MRSKKAENRNKVGIRNTDSEVGMDRQMETSIGSRNQQPKRKDRSADEKEETWKQAHEACDSKMETSNSTLRLENWFWKLKLEFWTLKTRLETSDLKVRFETWTGRL